MVDWVAQPCSFAMQVLYQGGGSIGPLDQFQRVRYNGQDTWATYRAYADGYAGYVPNNARYMGSGIVTPIGASVPGRERRQDTNLSSFNKANNESDLRRLSFADYQRLQDWSLTAISIDSDGVGLIRDMLKQTLEEKTKCRELVEGMLKLINQAGYSLDKGIDLLNIFDNLDAFYRITNSNSGIRAGMQSSVGRHSNGEISHVKRYLILRDHGYYRTLSSMNNLIHNVIHELFHGAGALIGESAISHIEMGALASMAANNLGLVTGEFPVRGDFEDGNKGDKLFEGARTRFFNSLIAEHCNISPRLKTK
jgi:hypothetical protein